MVRWLGIGLMAAVLLALAAPAAAGDGCAGPEPLLSPAMHRALFTAHDQLAKGKHQQAAETLARYVRSNPGAQDFRLSFALGLAAYYQKDLARARRYLQEAVDQRRCYIPAIQNLAVVLLESNQPLAAARLSLEAYRRSRPKQPRLLYQAAACFLVGRRPAQAAPLLEELAALPQPKTHWLKAQVRCYLVLKRYGQARPIVARLLAREPGQSDLWHLAAELNLRAKKYGQAAAALEVAYRLDPPSPSGWRQLASLYQAAGVPHRAAAYLSRAAGDRPSAGDLEKLAKVYLGGHYLDQALTAARQAARARPTAQRWALVGRIHLVRSDYAQALPAFQRAAKIGDPQGRYSMAAGYCAWQLDRLGAAEKAFAQAMRLAGKDQTRAREAARALKAVREHLRHRRSQAAPHKPPSPG